MFLRPRKPLLKRKYWRISSAKAVASSMLLSSSTAGIAAAWRRKSCWRALRKRSESVWRKRT